MSTISAALRILDALKPSATHMPSVESLDLPLHVDTLAHPVVAIGLNA